MHVCVYGYGECHATGVDPCRYCLKKRHLGFEGTTNVSYHDYYTRPDESKRKKDGVSIKNVIFNAPATIVLWSDGTKTVVKSGDYDVYDPEKGLAMAIAKKALGNEGNYYEVFKAWLPEEDKPTSDNFSFDSERFREKLSELGKTLSEGINDGINKIRQGDKEHVQF